MISCKCTTYGRVGFLEEALQSFLLQTDEDCELIIVNDYPLQKLVFDHPRVKIFNFDKTFDTIGEKDNFAVEQCSGDIIATWDDDDIAMPNHISNIKKYWKEDTNILQWANAVYYNNPNITKLTWVGNSGMVYSKSIWEIVGKHPIMNAGGDSFFTDKIIAKGGVVHAHPPDEDVSWWYRWSMPNLYHQSGMGVDTGKVPNIIKRHSLHIERLRVEGLIPTGNIQLKPNWKKEYIEMLKQFNYASRNR